MSLDKEDSKKPSTVGISPKSFEQFFLDPHLIPQTLAQTLLDTKHVAILVADNDANYLYTNKTAQDLFGYSEGEFLLMNVRDLKIPEGTKVSSQYKNFIKTGKETGIFNFFNKVGEQKMAAYVAFTLQDDVNVSIMTEITKDDFPNIATKIDDQISADIVGQLPCVVFRFTVDSKSGRFYSYISPQLKSFFHLKRQPKLGVWKLSDLVVSEQRYMFMESVNEAIEQKKPWRFVADYQCGDGQIRRFEARSNPRLINGNMSFEGIIFEVLPN
jgi:PAS domain S-box-containing protein